MNGLGWVWREAGHSRVPDPPESTTDSKRIEIPCFYVLRGFYEGTSVTGCAMACAACTARALNHSGAFRKRREEFLGALPPGLEANACCAVVLQPSDRGLREAVRIAFEVERPVAADLPEYRDVARQHA